MWATHQLEAEVRRDRCGRLQGSHDLSEARTDDKNCVPARLVNVPAETRVRGETALTAAAAAVAHMTALASAHCCREAGSDMSYLQTPVTLAENARQEKTLLLHARCCRPLRGGRCGAEWGHVILVVSFIL